MLHAACTDGQNHSDVSTVVLSPHFDDAVLSCWDLLEGPQDVSVINVFAGVPPAGTQRGWWDLASGNPDPAGMVRDRIQEDRAALASVARQAVNLGFLDAQYRTAGQSVDAVAAALRSVLLPDACVWAPAALSPPGGYLRTTAEGREPHPDHVVVRAAALALRADGRPVTLYADLPHASAGGWPDWITAGTEAAVGARWRSCLRTAGIGDDWVAKVRRLADDAFQRKVRAVRCYASQIASLERSFGRRLDDPALLGCEVLWSLP